MGERQQEQRPRYEGESALWSIRSLTWQKSLEGCQQGVAEGKWCWRRSKLGDLTGKENHWWARHYRNWVCTSPASWCALYTSCPVECLNGICPPCGAPHCTSVWGRWLEKMLQNCRDRSWWLSECEERRWMTHIWLSIFSTFPEMCVPLPAPVSIRENKSYKLSKCLVLLPCNYQHSQFPLLTTRIYCLDYTVWPRIVILLLLICVGCSARWLHKVI